MRRLQRRVLSWALLAMLIAPVPVASAAAETFGFDVVARQAADLASRPYAPAAPADARLAAYSYDQYRSIRFRPERTLWRGSGSLFQVQFFPLGRGFTRPLDMYEVVDGKVLPLRVPGAAFDAGKGLPAGTDVPVPVDGAAGWRLSFPLNDAKVHDEVAVFLGASYFRAVGAGQAYGLSARALAVDTAGGSGEEFPAFTAFWLERPAPGAREMHLYALLDSPRVTGAYHFVVRPGTDTVIDVRARLVLREPVATLGIAPLTSMFLSGENQPLAGDYRPEVHDSDGLLVATAEGERLWRPLSNPSRPFVTSFATRSPRGFGLMQRDRAFSSYEDLEAHYERRPSGWVEPIGDWGPGRVELLQFGTPDETHDNIAAYWVAEKQAAPGVPIDLAWRVHWTVDGRQASELAGVLQTRVGHGYRDGAIADDRQQLHVDFSGPALDALVTDGALQVVASGNANVRNVRAIAYPNRVRGGWRVSLDYERIDPAKAVELRAHLEQAGRLLSETWAYSLAPE